MCKAVLRRALYECYHLSRGSKTRQHTEYVKKQSGDCNIATSSEQYTREEAIAEPNKLPPGTASGKKSPLQDGRFAQLACVHWKTVNSLS